MGRNGAGHGIKTTSRKDETRNKKDEKSIYLHNNRALGLSTSKKKK
jgi:hypothetical protein